MVLGCAVAALALPGAVAPSSAQVQEVLIPDNYAAVLDAKNLFYFALRREFYYCAIGEETWIQDELGRRRVLRITNLVYPKQTTGETKSVKDNTESTWVTHDACPPGTKADIHNHPAEGMYVFSGPDLEIWNTYKFKYHIILFPAKDPDNPENYLTRAAVWYIDGETMRLIRKVRIYASGFGN